MENLSFSYRPYIIKLIQSLLFLFNPESTDPWNPTHFFLATWEGRGSYVSSESSGREEARAGETMGDNALDVNVASTMWAPQFDQDEATGSEVEKGWVRKIQI